MSVQPASTSSTPLFHYSDGDEVENRILRILETASDITSTSPELAEAITDWPTRVHFSPDRRNLLLPLQHLLHGRILELGAGCGGLTRFLGELGGDITAIEGSARRTAAAESRCRDLPNVHIVNAEFRHWQTDQQFDIILAIGFLEYSRMFSGSDAAFEDNLDRIRTLLSPDGVLILAIENQLGLKYLSGAPEDHVGEPYFGVNDSYGPKTPVTFAKAELTQLLHRSGFTYLDFCYPLPDYKLPELVVHSSALHHRTLELPSILRDLLSGSVKDEPALDPGRAFGVLSRNRLFEDLANSFLVTARLRTPDLPIDSPPLVQLFSTHRRAHFRKVTTFEDTEAGIVVRRRALSDSPPSADAAYHRELRDEPYIAHDHWWIGLATLVKGPGWDVKQVAEWALPWIHFLRENCLGPDHTVLPSNFVDCTPFNVIRQTNGGFLPFDLEFVSDREVWLEFVVFRGLWQSFTRLRRCASPAISVPLLILDTVTAVMDALGMPVARDRLTALVLQEVELELTVHDISRESVSTAFATAKLPLPAETRRHQGGRSYNCQVYWRSSGQAYEESRSSTVVLNMAPLMQRIDLPIPPFEHPVELRFDIADRTGIVEIAAITLTDLRGQEIQSWSAADIVAAPCRGMRCFPPAEPGDDRLIAFAFTDDPSLDLVLEAKATIGCIHGALLRVVCRWPIEYPAIERVLSGTHELCARAELQSRISDLQSVVDASASAQEQSQAGARQVAEVFDRKLNMLTDALSRFQTTFEQYVSRPWWKRRI